MSDDLMARLSFLVASTPSPHVLVQKSTLVDVLVEIARLRAALELARAEIAR